MKKTIVLLITVLVLSCNFKVSYALDINADISNYKKVLHEVNEKYGSSMYIMEEVDFHLSPVKKQYNDSYQTYINSILEVDLHTFKNQSVLIAQENSIYNFSALSLSRSTLTTKTISFYNGRNTMKLTYKYSGNTFDTSYKPTATVTKYNSSNYFIMSSYTGTFKNSNTTYSVTAYGKVYTTVGIVNNKNFVVNFNL